MRARLSTVLEYSLRKDSNGCQIIWIRRMQALTALPPLLLLYLSVKGWMLLLEHGATDQVRKLVRQGAALKVLWQYLHCTSSL